MRLQTTGVLLALFAGCTARAGTINFSEAITSGQATEYGGAYASITFSGLGFGGELSGRAVPSTTSYFLPSSSGGQVEIGAGPLDGYPSDGGSAGYDLNGISFACNASYFGNCGMEMIINYVFNVPLSEEPGTNIATGWFTANVIVQAYDAPNSYNGGFSGSGTATFTLSPYPPPGGGPPTSYNLDGAVFNFVAVPEPSSASLAALGLAAFAFVRVVKLRRPLRSCALSSCGGLCGRTSPADFPPIIGMLERTIEDGFRRRFQTFHLLPKLRIHGLRAAEFLYRDLVFACGFGRTRSQAGSLRHRPASGG